MKKIIYLAVFLVGICNIIYAQVTIGLDGAPEEGAILQLRNKSTSVDGGINADKGLILPRVELVSPDLLTIVENPTDTDKLNHKGTVVYNMTADEDANLEEGVYIWDGERWNSLQPAPLSRNAEFTLLEECNNTLIAGTYYTEQTLTSSNYLRLIVYVTSVGDYDFFAQAEDEDGNNNGYYFTATGSFATTGIHVVYLAGAGTPIMPSTTGNEDVVYIYSNGAKLETDTNVYCTKTLWIGDPNISPRYAMVCSSVTVSGVYKKGIPLGSTHTITLRLNVTSGSEGAPWEIWTDEVDGISFRGSGLLGAAAVQEVTLYGEGTFNNTAPKIFTISSNSESNQSICVAVISPVVSTKKVIEIGSSSGSSYGLTSGGDWGAKAMLTNTMNYGPNANSIVQCDGFTSFEHFSRTTDANLQEWTGMVPGVTPADIIIYTHSERPSSSQINLLVDYVNRGGILICFDQDDSNRTLRELLTAMFEEEVASSDITSVGRTADLVIKMNSNVNDEIINGPFGDCRQQQWGEDFSNTAGLTFIPRNVIVYAGSVLASTGQISSKGVQATIMRHKTKNFFWWGDGGAISSNGKDDTNDGRYPFKVESRTINGVTYPKYPVYKTSYGSGKNKFSVCNSILFANVMAWAIKTAEESGINSGN